MRKGVAIFLSILIAVAAFIIFFILIGLEVLDLFAKHFAVPGDASSGDTAGWDFVVSLPILIPANIVISLIIGSIAARISYKRLRRSDKSKINLLA